MQQSWSDKFSERIRNVIKYDSKKARSAGRERPSSPKRQKKTTTLVRRYPVSSYELSDAATMERHVKAILDEMSKGRPRDTLLLPLLKSTFGDRRMFVMNDATCVGDVLTVHPALSRTAVVSCVLLHTCIHTRVCMHGEVCTTLGQKCKLDTDQ